NGLFLFSRVADTFSFHCHSSRPPCFYFTIPRKLDTTSILTEGDIILSNVLLYGVFVKMKLLHKGISDNVSYCDISGTNAI
ncbi:hypothetical protein M3649_21260, partial [Ureibacillus chungkukjangi]|uniref:hypothetical protein n=1 Tax=Ureibacillus chungkukjangi TaxID=1202712 RepID=UPI00203BC0FC